MEGSLNILNLLMNPLQVIAVMPQIKPKLPVIGLVFQLGYIKPPPFLFAKQIIIQSLVVLPLEMQMKRKAVMRDK